MHCSQKTFHFFSASIGPACISSDISITLRKSHEIIFAGYFWKITKTCKMMFLRRLREVTEIQIKMPQKFIFEMPLSMEIWLRSLRDILWRLELTQTKTVNTANQVITFWDLFALSNLVKIKTCTQSVCNYSLNIIPQKNKEASLILVLLQHLSHYHKLKLLCGLILNDFCQKR